MNAKPTPRPWIAHCLGSEGYQVRIGLPHVSKELRSFSPIADCTARPFEESKANAEFIATAYEACASINPDNPQAVAEGLAEIVKALKRTLPENQPEPGYECSIMVPATVIINARAALAKIEGKK